ncbi:MAG: DsbC family protein [Chromatiales bacterium]|jgi:thiol:disulfide interchange protein DsbC
MNQQIDKALRLAGSMTLAASLLLVGTYSTAMAEESPEIQQVRTAVNKLIPNGKVDAVEPSPVAGIYEVLVGTQLYYVSKDGKYLFNGKLYDLDKREDLTSPKTQKVKLDAINAAGEENMIIFAPENYQHTITVFTDIDCGYCRKLHSEIDQYNDLGIRVRYLSFPRAGVGSPSYNKAVSVWCADNRQEALTQAKAGKEIDSKECDNPVKEQMELGQAVGVNGTPALFLENGEMLPGYVPPAKLAALLRSKSAHDVAATDE